jgi:protein SCO1
VSPLVTWEGRHEGGKAEVRRQKAEVQNRGVRRRGALRGRLRRCNISSVRRRQILSAVFGVFAGVLIAMVAGTGWMVHRLNSREVSAAEVAGQVPRVQVAGPLPVFWEAPEFSYTDENGRPFASNDVRGHVWITDFFFTTCTNICPMMTYRMSQLLKAIPAASVEFVSFSVDPDHDTPSVLKAYAQGWKADETRWHFLATDKTQLMQTAAGMKVFVQLPQKDQPIQHSSLFTLVDGEGQVRGVYDSDDPAALHRLAADAMNLAGVPSIADSAWEDPAESVNMKTPGAGLYISSGCVACHTQGRVAPSLNGLYGSEVRMDDGRTLTADNTYLRRSLLEPDAFRVAGYPRLMPGYRAQLNDEEVGEVVQYIKSLAGEVPPTVAGQPMDSGHAIDPVCKMEVDARDNPLHAEFEGKTYYFCSATCLRLFLLAPGNFVKGGK